MTEERLVQEITPMHVDFARWYTDIVKKAELIGYTSVRGCCILRPYACAIWENIQRILDTEFKRLGHENVVMPMLIPESLMQKEKDHVDGFAPEVAWVTMGGSEELTERLCIRPTSETLFCEHFASIIQSYRDLPKLYNQWCSVVRWEKTTRPFLRTLEFHWQEGHTMHATSDEAMEETRRMLNVYADFAEGDLAIPVLRGQKTEKEKFAGGVATFTIEAMMHDGKALQAGTSHFFGDGFAKAFDITFTDKDNIVKTPFQTSWGMSTRIIGGIIMTHGDDSGLVLPPAIAPIQVVIVPIAAHKGGVMERVDALVEELKQAGIRVKVDTTDASPGWKFAEYEMKGVPLRIEIGPRDVEQCSCVVVSRDNREKVCIALSDVAAQIPDLLEAFRQRLYNKALDNREGKTRTAHSMKEMVSFSADENFFIRSMWCGKRSCEDAVKEQAGLTSRVIPFDQQQVGDTCPVCGEPAQHMIIWGRAY